MTRHGQRIPADARRLRRRLRSRPPLELAVLTATALLEVRDGRRDADQLTELVDPRVARQLAALVRRRRHAPRGGDAPTLRRVVVDGSHPHRVNVVVVLDRNHRVVPVCVEVRLGPDGWRVTSLAVPDDHHPEPVTPDRPDWERPANAEPW